MLGKLGAAVRRFVRGCRTMIDRGMDKAARTVSERTSGRYDQRVRMVRQRAGEAMDKAETKPAEEPAERPEATNSSQLPAGRQARRAYRRSRTRH